jgi:hypothetical protein
MADDEVVVGDWKRIDFAAGTELTMTKIGNPSSEGWLRRLSDSPGS